MSDKNRWRAGEPGPAIAWRGCGISGELTPGISGWKVIDNRPSRTLW